MAKTRSPSRPPALDIQELRESPPASEQKSCTPEWFAFWKAEWEETHSAIWDRDSFQLNETHSTIGIFPCSPTIARDLPVLQRSSSRLVTFQVKNAELTEETPSNRDSPPPIRRDRVADPPGSPDRATSLPGSPKAVGILRRAISDSSCARDPGDCDKDAQRMREEELTLLMDQQINEAQLRFDHAQEARELARKLSEPRRLGSDGGAALLPTAVLSTTGRAARTSSAGMFSATLSSISSEYLAPKKAPPPPGPS
ncbi:hypothetical protein T484DRAFT_1827917 [Baffinella frigidus]|nr:hypothetical protein T484DRAFT_1827917 [Cryptophyta sp. CCMP2293]